MGQGNFNPRSSCEERLKDENGNPLLTEFQSTLLMRGATGDVDTDADTEEISIHAPHARSDKKPQISRPA